MGTPNPQVVFELYFVQQKKKKKTNLSVISSPILDTSLTCLTLAPYDGLDEGTLATALGANGCDSGQADVALQPEEGHEGHKAQLGGEIYRNMLKISRVKP